jgi:hypothetical protein
VEVRAKLLKSQSLLLASTPVCTGDLLWKLVVVPFGTRTFAKCDCKVELALECSIVDGGIPATMRTIPVTYRFAVEGYPISPQVVNEFASNPVAGLLHDQMWDLSAALKKRDSLVVSVEFW